MEKKSHLPVDERPVVPRREEGRWRLATARTRVVAGTFLFIVSCLWIAHATETLPQATTSYRICKWPLSVEERALSILKKNPLIGTSLALYRHDAPNADD